MKNPNLNFGTPQKGDLVHFVNNGGKDCIGTVTNIDGHNVLIHNKHTTTLDKFSTSLGTFRHKDRVTVLFRNSK